MPRRRTFLIAILTVTLLLTSPHAAFAILVPYGSPRNIAFSQAYPEYARKQVRAALENENCKFIDGHFINGVSQLHFGGDTAAANELLDKLANSPATTVAVSFKTIDHGCDWLIVHHTQSNRFDVIVNLKSGQISVEGLVIPAAKGPELQR